MTQVVTPSSDTLDFTWSGPRLTFRKDRHTGQAVNARGDTVRSEYDVLNRTRRTIGPMGDTTSFTYDSLFLRQVRDPLGNVYQSTYNAGGWPTVQIDPRGKADSLFYDRDGRLSGMTDRLGVTFSFTYDALGQLTQRVAGTDTTIYAADPNGLFSAVQNAASTDTLLFDVAGRPVTAITVRGSRRWSLDYGYRVEGLRSSLSASSPWARQISYGYDASMRLDTLRDMFGGETRITYDGNGQPVSVHLPTGDSITRDFSALRMVKLTHSEAAIDAAVGEQWDLDELFRVGVVHGAAVEDTARTYGYDELGRLTSYADSTSSQQPICSYVPNFGYVCGLPGATQVRSASYGYDAVGNRTDSGASIMTGNRLTAFAGMTLEYDDAGRLTRRLGGGVDQHLYWNALGQLDSVTNNTAPTVRYEYDGLGRRVKKFVAGGDRRWIYDCEETPKYAQLGDTQFRAPAVQVWAGIAPLRR